MNNALRSFPLLLAAFEVRFSQMLRPTDFEQTATCVYEAIKHTMPDSNWADTPDRPGNYFASNTAEFSDSLRTASTTVRPDLLRLEVGKYEGYDRFRDTVAQVLNGLEKSGTVQAFSRVGFRTLDELTLPWSGRNPRQWKGLISEQLLAPLQLFEDAQDIQRFSGKIQFSKSDIHRINLTYGALPRPTLRVSPARLSTPRRKTPGGVFMIDIDSYILQETPALQNIVTGRLDELHEPIDEIFNTCVTDLYRGYHHPSQVQKISPDHMSSLTAKED